MPTTTTASPIPALASAGGLQDQLRHSVRYYLSLGYMPMLAQQLTMLLQATDTQLTAYLLTGTWPTDLRSTPEEA